MAAKKDTVQEFIDFCEGTDLDAVDNFDLAREILKVYQDEYDRDDLTKAMGEAAECAMFLKGKISDDRRDAVARISAQMIHKFAVSHW